MSKNPKNIPDSKIAEACDQLDHTNDEHWTGSGLPQMSAVEGLAGDKGITRADIKRVRPDLRRDPSIAMGLGKPAVLFCTQNVIGEGDERKRVPVAIVRGYELHEPHKAVADYNAQVDTGLPEEPGYGYQLCDWDEWDGDTPPEVEVVRQA